jgi:hypothetical protein
MTCYLRETHTGLFPTPEGNASGTACKAMGLRLGNCDSMGLLKIYAVFKGFPAI